jgi:hypothetical protein
MIHIQNQKVPDRRARNQGILPGHTVAGRPDELANSERVGVRVFNYKFAGNFPAGKSKVDLQRRLSALSDG